MKKFMLFALAALCVSAAQAVTWDWTKATTVDVGANATTQVQNLAGLNTSFACKLVFSGLSYKDSNNGAYFMGLKTDNTYWGFRISEDANRNVYSMASGGHIADVVSAKTLSGDLTVLFVYDDTAKTLEMSFGDTYTYTATNINLDSQYFVGFAGPPEAWNANNLSHAFDFTGASYSYTTATIVPEPTALALLALGVAGLALKRKVA